MKSRLKRKKLGLATVIVFCSLCFLIGFYASALLSQNVPGVKPRLRRLEMMENGGEGEEEASSMPHGVTGDESVRSIPFQVLSWKPRALYFPNFATAEQCQAIIERAKVNLKPSALALRLGETAESTQGTRTSSGTFVSASEESTGALDYVEKKIARATMIPRNHGEAFNILRYELGQKYDSHYDVFNPAEYGPQTSQRIASFLLYLSDVEEGGETMFPFENGANMGAGYDYKQCVGLKVKPRKGDGLLFYSVFPNGTIDQTSLHGSCPVSKGEKWVATKWIRDQDQQD